MNTNIETKPSTKAIFAAFLNLARNNIFIILNHIQHRLGESQHLDESALLQANLWKWLQPDTGKKPEQEKQYAAIRQLSRHFPFLSENQDAGMTKSLFLAILERLNEERNAHTHFFYQNELRTAISGLDQIKNEAKDLLVQKIADGIERQAEIAKQAHDSDQLTDQRYRGFDHPDLETLKQMDFQIFAENSLSFSEIGLAFFITLFLEKKFAAQFLSKVPHLQNLSQKDANEARLLREWLWALSCRIPQPKLESSEILMDILNELHRAPQPLYNFLNQEDKKKFEVDFQSEDESLMLALGNQKNLLKRKEDRFPYFAMRAMDELKLFDRLRFQVHLGKWLRESGRASTIIEDRKIYENLRTFGRLDYFSPENAPEDWKRTGTETDIPVSDEFLDTTWHHPDIEQFAPHYQITGNRIGIKFRRDISEATWPSLSEYHPRGDKGAQRSKAGKFSPDAILSTYELGPLFFYQYLHKMQTDEQGNPLIEQNAETFLADYMQRFKQFCQDVKAGQVNPVTADTFQKKIRRPFEKTSEQNTYNQEEFEELEARKVVLQKILDQDPYRLKIKDLPDALKEYLLNYEYDTAESLKLKLVQRKKETEETHKQFRKAIDRLIEKEQRIPDHLTNDVLAEELVEEILTWRPVDQRKKKFAEKNKQTLLRILKQYPHNKLALEKHIKWSKDNTKSMQLIDKKYDFAHPFLDKAAPFLHLDIRSFYLQYLDENRKWLQSMLQPAQENEPQPNQYFRKQPKPFFESALQKVQEKYAQLKSEIDTLNQEIGETETILNGELATYLIHDFFFLKPRNEQEDAKNFGMPNSQEYQRLHAALALYSSDIPELVNLMEKLDLLGEDAKFPHPFLQRIDPQNYPGIKAFYEAYLLEKIDWLNLQINNLSEVKKKISKKKRIGSVSLSAASRTIQLFGNKRLWKQQKDNSKNPFEAVKGYLEQKPKPVKDYFQSPMFLPRGIFNEAINTALQKIQDLDISPEDNFSRCLAKFTGEESQPFYHWPRTYQFDELEEKVVWNGEVDSWDSQQKTLRDAIQALKKEEAKNRQKRLPEEKHARLQRLKRLARTAKGNEQQIRYYQTMDRVLLLILRQLAETKQPNEGFWIEADRITLKNIHPEVLKKSAEDTPSNLLNAPILMKIKVNDKIILDRLPIKRYGDFRRFFKDRRLPGLLQYFDPDFIDHKLLEEIGVEENPENAIPRQQLVKELEDYDAGRDKVFADVLELEKAIYEIRTAQFEAKIRDQANTSHLAHTKQLKLIQEKLSTELEGTLIHYRNSFAHNEIFYSEYLKGKADSAKKQIMRPIMAHMSGTYYWMMGELG